MGAAGSKGCEEMTKQEHHELCLGILNLCYAHVPIDIQVAIKEGIDAAQELGFNVDSKNLGIKGLFSGGHA